MGKPWLPPEDQILIDYCKLGKSQADAWHDHFGTRSYSSVVGRADRLGLKFVGRRNGKSNYATVSQITKVKTAKPLPIPKIDESHLPTISALIASDRHCAWYVGDVRKLKRCAEYAIPGGTYCVEHTRRVFATVKPVHSNGVMA